MSVAELKIQTNSLPGSRLSVELEIPADRCKHSYEEALSRLSRSVKLPGFRKGKVPKAVILQQVGVGRIRASALETLLENAWREALEKESIEPLCEPELKGGFESLLNSFNPNSDLSLVLETDVTPVATLKMTKGLQAKTEKVIFNPLQIDELIEQSRKQLATLVPVEKRSAEMGDIAVLSFKGKFEDGTEIEGGSAESMDIELEKGRMIPGFIEGIIGMNINDKKDLKCDFPKDYHEETARGKKAIFTVELKELKAKELPELDDNFAKQSSDKSTMAELREELEKRLKEDCERRQVTNRQESLVQALIEQVEVDLPKTLIDQEVRLIVEQTAQKFAQQGMDVKSMFTPELVKSLMDSSQEDAKKNLMRKFALKALADAEKINIEENAIESKMNEVRSELSGEKNIDLGRLKSAVADDLLEEKLLEWLEENSAVTEISPSTNKEEETNVSKSKQTKSTQAKTSKSQAKAKKPVKKEPKS